MPYGETVLAGRRFSFVSDGVVEAENAQRELFGFDRTREISSKSAQEIAEAAKAWGQNDDITVVTVRRSA
jgi:serine phosphatase RsbU (regulator of sigma subunit)